MTSAGKYVEKGDPQTLLVGMQNGTVTMENGVTILQKFEDRITPRSKNLISWLWIQKN